MPRPQSCCQIRLTAVAAKFGFVRAVNHSGDDGSGESHFTVVIESSAFDGVSRLQRQRMVNAALGDIPGQRVHALAIKAKSPED